MFVFGIEYRDQTRGCKRPAECLECFSPPEVCHGDNFLLKFPRMGGRSLGVEDKEKYKRPVIMGSIGEEKP
jgi:hypothetical protein